MYLEVTFDDGKSVQIEVSNSHTCRIIDPTNAVQDAFAFGGVSAVTLNQGAIPAPEASPPVDTVPAADTVPAPEPVTTDAPAVDPTVASTVTTTADAAPLDTAAAPVDATTTTDTTATDPALTQAVTDAQTSVATVTAAPVADQATLIAAALADIETALAEFPDSQELLDAKAQLENATPPPATA